MNYWLLIIPVTSALIGWIANRVLIKLLFHPRVPKKIAGFTFQGILPKRQKQLAERLGKLAGKEFLSFNSIEEKINDPENLQKILPMIEQHVDDFLRNRLKEEMPMISMFIGDKTIGKLKAALMKEIEELFPQVMKQFAGNLKNEIDIETLLTKKIEAFSTDKIEQGLYENMGKELRQVGMLGALVGFIIGVVQVLIIVLTI